MDTIFIHELADCTCFACPHINNPQKKFLFNIILAFLAASGFLLILLGCSLWPNGWWSIFVLLPLVLAGGPDFCFNRLRRRNDSSSDIYTSAFTDPKSQYRCRFFSLFQDWWFLAAGFCAATAFPCLIIALWHNDIVFKNTLALNISGTFLIGASMFVFIKLIYNKFNFSLLGNSIEMSDMNDNDISDDENLLNLDNEEE